LDGKDNLNVKTETIMYNDIKYWLIKKKKWTNTN